MVLAVTSMYLLLDGSVGGLFIVHLARWMRAILIETFMRAV